MRKLAEIFKDYGGNSTWANKQYHGHRTLPPDMAKVAKNCFHS